MSDLVACANGEIMYLHYLNNKWEYVHSDFNTGVSRETLHTLLDEWLDKGKRSRLFYIGDLSWVDS